MRRQVVPSLTKRLRACNLYNNDVLNDSRYPKGTRWSCRPQIARQGSVLTRDSPHCLYLVLFLHVLEAAHAYATYTGVDSNMRFFFCCQGGHGHVLRRAGCLPSLIPNKFAQQVISLMSSPFIRRAHRWVGRCPNETVVAQKLRRSA